MVNIVIVIGFVIIAALATYATRLLLKLKQQRQLQQQQQALQAQAQQQKLDEHIQSIRYVAIAMGEERCEVSEGVMRIGKLFGLLSLTEQVAGEFPATFKHFSIIESHPIMAARKELAKKERMKFDFARMRSEAELTEQILAEAKQLANFKPAPLH